MKRNEKSGRTANKDTEAAANIVLNIVLCRARGVFGIVLAAVISVFATNFLLCPQVLFNQYFNSILRTEN